MGSVLGVAIGLDFGLGGLENWMNSSPYRCVSFRIRFPLPSSL